MIIQTIDDLQLALRKQLYIADRGLATAIFLALKLQRPLFLEGEAGVDEPALVALFEVTLQHEPRVAQVEAVGDVPVVVDRRG